MAEIHELIERVTEPGLKAQLQAAVDKLAKQKKFGLVFEEHLPECTPLYEVPVKKGRLVSRKQGETNDLYVVLTITDGVATCLPKNGGEAVKLAVDELVSVAEFGEPIYPYLQPVDTVCHAPDSDLWHTLIEADNYHALQLLEYLYAAQVDCIYIDPPYNTGAFVADKPNALIVDFFAGSGTTLHAVNLLNAEDGGHRRCILVTNNEVSADEAKNLTAQGYQPGDPEWEKLGIAQYVTWPRTVCSIEGHNVNGQPLKGNYLGSERPMSDGFQANAAYFKLGFLDKTSVALGEQFRQMLPTLWMKAGAKGPCPTLDGGPIPPMLVLPENGFAVLTEEAAFEEFAAEVNAHPEIETVYLITDYEAGFQVMARSLKAPRTFQLYRDYLDNFRINTGRDRR